MLQITFNIKWGAVRLCKCLCATSVCIRLRELLCHFHDAFADNTFARTFYLFKKVLPDCQNYDMKQDFLNINFIPNAIQHVNCEYACEVYIPLTVPI